MARDGAGGHVARRRRGLTGEPWVPPWFYTPPTLGRTLSSLAATAAIVGAFWVGLALSHHGTSAAGADPVLTEVRQELLHSYYRPVPANALNAPSVSAIINALHDPYTEYLDPTQFRLLTRETHSTYPGIGVSILPEKRGLVVAATKPGPAERAGIRKGDVIVAIDGHTAIDASVSDVIRWILGPRGAPVTLDVLRDARILRFNVTREQLSAPTVQTQLLQNKKVRIGYVRLSALRIGATTNVARALTRLQRENAAGFVLDLRGNPGGVFSSAVGVSSLFLNRGVIVTLVGAHSRRHVYTAREGATKLPLVVLVDHETASAAEIVAAALQDNRRAVLVGENTYGKALVQSIRVLGNGAALRLTTAHYYTPSGADISLKGVVPDLHAVDKPSTRTDEALQAALQLFLH